MDRGPASHAEAEDGRPGWIDEIEASQKTKAGRRLGDESGKGIEALAAPRAGKMEGVAGDPFERETTLNVDVLLGSRIAVQEKHARRLPLIARRSSRDADHLDPAEMEYRRETPDRR